MSVVVLSIALSTLFGLCVIVGALARAGGHKSDAPSRNYNEPRI